MVEAKKQNTQIKGEVAEVTQMSKYIALLKWAGFSLDQTLTVLGVVAAEKTLSMDEIKGIIAEYPMVEEDLEEEEEEEDEEEDDDDLL